ncbi:K(+)-transporting ATPase subunit F [Amedibacterium intestinale]
MKSKSINKRGDICTMWLLAIMIAALAGYLVYALVNPEKF